MNENTKQGADDLAGLLRGALDANAEQRGQLFAGLYQELHRMAQRELRRNAHSTLSPTTLLHETYINLASREGAAFPDRAHFMAYAARVMRGLLIDYVRNRHAQKRGGQFSITALPTELAHAPDVDLDMEKLHEALESLGSTEPRLAECVDLKYFCGFSTAEIAQMWAVSERTVQRDWDKARLLLHQHMMDAKDS